MRVILVGGGKVGSFLARELVSDGHAVSIIEPSEERAQAAADDIDAVVVCGDGTDVGVLKSVDIQSADWLLAVTGLDEVNLVACQLALTLGVRKILARLNAPANRATFEALSIPVVAVTDLMVQVISHEIAVSDIQRIAVLGRGHVSLSEFEIADGFPSTELRDLDLPAPSVIVTVMREEAVFIPEATTVLEAGDRIVVVSSVAQEGAVRAVFGMSETSP